MKGFFYMGKNQISPFEKKIEAIKCCIENNKNYSKTF